MDVRVREHPVPGAGQLFHVELSDGSLVAISVEPSGRRELSLTMADADDPSGHVSLDAAEAVTLGALLSGVRFMVDRSSGGAPAAGVDVQTLMVGRASPAVGRRLDELGVPDPSGADVIAIIRDDTPELVEDDDARPCEPGDRLVLVGRPRELEALCRYLLG